MPSRESACCALSVDESSLGRAVRQHQCFLLDEVMRDLVKDLARGAVDVLKCLLHPAHNNVAVRNRIVCRGVVVRPVGTSQRLVGTQP